MAYRKNMAHRFFNIAKPTSFSSSSFSPSSSSFIKNKTIPHHEEPGFLRRFLTASPTKKFMISHQLPPLGDRILLLRNPEEERNSTICESKNNMYNGSGGNTISVEEVKKVLRASQIAGVRLKLRGMEKNCVSYAEFVEICTGDHDGINREEGKEIAKVLDDSGDVIVLGDLVYLHPHQVARAIESVIPLAVPNINDPKRKELEAMEEKKAKIDEKAKSLAKRELWCGWGLSLLLQIGFMRLTFWELSWDVMEPICFFVTNFNFLAGSAFFLKKSIEPSHEGIFNSRVAAKQERLMKTEEFDVEKFSKLKRPSPSSFLPSVPS